MYHKCFICTRNLELEGTNYILSNQEEYSIILCQIFKISKQWINNFKKMKKFKKLNYCFHCMERLNNIRCVLQDLKYLKNDVFQEKHLIKLQLKINCQNYHKNLNGYNKTHSDSNSSGKKQKCIRHEFTTELQSSSIKSMLAKVQKNKFDKIFCSSGKIKIMKNVNVKKINNTSTIKNDHKDFVQHTHGERAHILFPDMCSTPTYQEEFRSSDKIKIMKNVNVKKINSTSTIKNDQKDFVQHTHGERDHILFPDMYSTPTYQEESLADDNTFKGIQTDESPAKSYFDSNISNFQFETITPYPVENSGYEYVPIKDPLLNSLLNNNEFVQFNHFLTGNMTSTSENLGEASFRSAQPVSSHIEWNEVSFNDFNNTKDNETVPRRLHPPLISEYPTDCTDSYFNFVDMPYKSSNSLESEWVEQNNYTYNLSDKPDYMAEHEKSLTIPPAKTHREINPKSGNPKSCCNLCNKSFKDIYSLNVHARIHSGEKPFECTICGKRFRQKAHLNKHSGRHTMKSIIN